MKWHDKRKDCSGAHPLDVTNPDNNDTTPADYGNDDARSMAAVMHDPRVAAHNVASPDDVKQRGRHNLRNANAFHQDAATQLDAAATYSPVDTILYANKKDNDR